MLQKLTYLEIEEYVWLILTNFLTYFFFPQMAVKCLNRTKWKFEIRLMVLLLLISKVETRKIIQTILWTGLGKIYFESSSKLIWIAFELNLNWSWIKSVSLFLYFLSGNSLPNRAPDYEFESIRHYNPNKLE